MELIICASNIKPNKIFKNRGWKGFLCDVELSVFDFHDLSKYEIKNLMNYKFFCFCDT